MKNRRPPIATHFRSDFGSGTMSLTGGMKRRDGTKVAFEVTAPREFHQPQILIILAGKYFSSRKQAIER